MKPQIYPVVLCGGMGARLWPMSRVQQPKQFQPTNGKGSLSYFQATLQRHRGPGFAAPIVVTNLGQGALVHRQLRDLQIKARVLAEPVARNTGPAVLAAALSAHQDDPDAQILVVPSDHVIKGDLNTTVLAMQQAAADGRIVLFGVPPAYPETGYGYIIDGGMFRAYPGLHRVETFLEKPSFDVAKSLISTGCAYWASGISLFRAETIIAEFRRLDPATLDHVSAAVQHGIQDEGSLILEPTEFAKARAEPTERIIFERSPHVALAPTQNLQWDDVGAWNAVHKIAARDDNGNLLTGDVIATDTRNTLVQGNSRLVAVIGLNDMIVVDTPDALLVMNRNNAQDVKQIVDHLKQQNRREVHTHAQREAHWGQEETLATAPGYNMRLLVVTPGATVRVNGTGQGPSMLTMLNGTGSYEKDGQVIMVARGQSVHVPSDLSLPLTNTSASELRVVQLMFTHEGDDHGVTTGVEQARGAKTSPRKPVEQDARPAVAFKPPPIRAVI
jgi:mannose-1-phosphate guanylyltransferase / mannose-6-phosphate isomerase